ncbi:hypothetical protein QBC43DRAFT_254437 [Cladorrhinum sp. PSN259]|nr:hypothetical protein QBC43DRAFT_254437 [Cladorrhinum sp. PSN259]
MPIDSDSYIKLASPSVESASSEQWRPRYLRRGVLALFIVSCSLVLVSTQALLAISNRQQGLATTHASLHYLWTYGPTATLTVIGAFWSRAEYQSKLAAPWSHMSNTQRPVSADQSILLDYLDKWLPNLLWKACKNRDWIVVLASLIRLMLTLTTVLSTSLFSLRSISTTERVSVKLESRFRNESIPPDSIAAGKSALITVMGFINNSIPHPPGTSSMFAHQRFDKTRSPFTDAEVTTDCDGISIELVCEKAKVDWFQNYPRHNFMNLSISTPDGCSLPYIVPYNTPTESSYLAQNTFGRYWVGYCGNSSLKREQDFRLGIAVAELVNYGFADSDSSRSISRSVQLLCKTSYRLDTLDVVTKPNGDMSLSVAAKSQPRLLANITASQLISSMYTADDKSGSEQAFPNVCSGYLSDSLYCNGTLDRWMLLGLLLDSPAQLPPFGTLFNETYLEKLTVRVTRDYLIQAINERLTESVAEEKLATATRFRNRLVMRSTTSHFMAATLTMSIFFMFTLIAITPRHGVAPCDPNTMINIAACLRDSTNALKVLIGSGAASSASLQPIALRPVVRVTMILLGGGIVATLEFLLRKSRHKDGIVGLLEDDTIARYVWSITPAIVSRLFADYLTTLDFILRSRESVHRMSSATGCSYRSTVGLNIMDRSLVGILGVELKTGSVVPLSTTLASLLGSLLTVLSASLFITQSTEGYVPSIELSADSFAGSIPLRGNFSQRTYISTSLILNRNMEYPPFTYQDLVFPRLSLAEIPRAVTNLDSLKVTATLPALRPKLSCELYDASSIRLFSPTRLAFSPYHTGKEDYTNATEDESTALLEDYATHSMMDCASDLVYVWGNISLSPEAGGPMKSPMFPNTTTSLFAYACNETIEVVQTRTQLLGPGLKIDTQNPPAVIGGLETDSHMMKSRNDWSNDIYLGNLPTGSIGMDSPDQRGLDAFFQLLLSSNPSISTSTLTDNSTWARQKVADAISRQHRILRAEILDSEFRQANANGSNETFIFTAPGGGNPATFSGNATYSLDRTRLSQDPSSTRVLQAVFGAITLLSAVGWVLQRTSVDPEIEKLPFHDRSLTSVASVMALLADSNIFDFLPPKKDPQRQQRKHTARFGCGVFSSVEDDKKSFEEAFEGFRFKLGWRVISDAQGENGWRRAFTVIAVPKMEAKDLESSSDWQERLDVTVESCVNSKQSQWLKFKWFKIQLFFQQLMERESAPGRRPTLLDS